MQYTRSGNFITVCVKDKVYQISPHSINYAYLIRAVESKDEKAFLEYFNQPLKDVYFTVVRDSKNILIRENNAKEDRAKTLHTLQLYAANDLYVGSDEGIYGMYNSISDVLNLKPNLFI